MERVTSKKTHSHSFLAWFLIIVGILWFLKKNGWEVNLPWISEFAQGGSLHSLAVPLIIILIGFILIAGRRFFGTLLLIAGILILVPHFILIPGILMVFFLPVLLLVAGIVILSKLFF